MRFTPLQKFVFTVSLAIVGVGLLAWFFWWTVRTVDSVRLEIAEINSRIASREEQRKSVLAFARLVEGRPHDFERIVGHLIDPSNPVTFIEALEGLAKKTQNKIKLDVGSATISEGELIFNVAVEGTKQNVFKYLKLVELLPYELTIEGFDFNASGTRTQSAGTGAPSRTELQTILRVKTPL